MHNAQISIWNNYSFAFFSVAAAFPGTFIACIFLLAKGEIISFQLSSRVGS